MTTVSTSQQAESLLDSCRVLDLTDEKGQLCGRILGDLGADVVKIEPVGGDPSRNIGPFYHHIPHPEKSLYWFAYNANKKSITLNIKAADGKEIFKSLVKKADFIIESSPVGFMDEIGLSYQVLAEINPRIIMVSITPFGQTGPYKDYKAPDIVAIAMGGEMYVTGEPDRPPLRIGFPQASLHAGAEAAVAAMIAYYYQQITGEGQYIDVSTRESLLPFSATSAPSWYMLKELLKRHGSFRAGTAAKAIPRIFWPCKDGYVSFTVLGTPSGAKSNIKLMEWMDSEEMAEPLKSFNWDGFDRRTATQETQTYVDEAVAPFILKHTKEELLKGATERGVMLLPVNSPKELLQSIQLQAREFWTEVEHPELGTSIIYPGAFIKSSEVSCSIRRRAPLIGEHNGEIYQGELGFTKEELLQLRQLKII